MVLSDSLLIVAISLFTAFLGEGVTYFLVYRTDKYKKLKAEIEKQTKKRK
jgi:calcium load-activated calcium channel